MTPESNQILTNWDYFFRVWAVAGPLLVAAVSTIWARRISKSNRDHAEKREKLKYQRSLQEAMDAQKAKKAELRRNEVKDLVVRATTAAQAYVMCRSDSYTKLRQSDDPVIIKYFEEFASSIAAISFIGDKQLEDLGTALWNSSMDMPVDYNNPPDDWHETVEKFKDAKADLLRRGSELVHEIA